MALPYTDLTAYSSDMYVKKATEIVYLNSPVFVRLHTRRQDRFLGGLAIRRTLIHGELNGGAIGRGEGFDISHVPVATALRVDMKGYGVSFSVYAWDAMLNEGPFSFFSQVELGFQAAALTMAKKLATDMYLQDSGARAKCLTGFEQWIDDGTLYATIGGITRTDLMAAGTVGALSAYYASLTSFNLQSLNRAYANAHFGNDHVDLIPCTVNGYQLIWNATQLLQRYQDPQSDIGKIGFQSFRFNAAEVVVDRYMPTGTSGRMFGLNTNYIEWYFSQNPMWQWGFTGFKTSQAGIDAAGQWLVGCNIVVPNPRTCFKLASTLF